MTRRFADVLPRLKNAALRPAVVASLFALLAAGAGIQRVMLGPDVIEGRAYTHYNNYALFKASFAHLVQGKDLYVLYPAEHWDLFKYSPTFAALMAPFAALPDAPGLVIWSLVGALTLFVGIRRLPVPDSRARMAAAWFVALPMLQSLQNTQSNALVAGLMILSFACLERNHRARAALAIALSFYIKIYGAATLLLVALYPARIRTVAWLALWMIGLGLLPLILVSPSHLAFLYQSWAALLATDHSASTGVSVVVWLQRWLGLDLSKPGVMLAGLAFTLLPLRHVRAYADPTFRVLVLATLLIWVVIFNHKAEPSTFVIAVCGVALWYFAQPSSRVRLVLLALVFVFTGLSTTSVFPVLLRRRLVQPFSLRVMPCLMVWAAAVWQLTLTQWRPRSESSGG